MRRMTINGSEIDLPSTPIGINWQYLNMSEPDKRYLPFSSTILIPFSPKNNKIFGYANNTGGSMTKVRDLPVVNYWWGYVKIIDNGYLKVNSITDKGFNCSITGRNTVIESIAAWGVDSAINKVRQMFVYSDYEDAIDSLIAGYDATPSSFNGLDSNYGFLFPRVLEDPITSGNQTIYDLTDLWQHEVWVSAAAIMRGLQDETICTFNVFESGSAVAFETSNLYNYLTHLYTPAWNHVLEYSGGKWIISHKTTGTRLINGKYIDRATLSTFGGYSIWDFIKLIAQKFCCLINQVGTVFTLIPFNELGSLEVDLSGKSKNPVKNINIPGFEYENFIRYKNTDNLPADYAQVTLLAPVNPVSSKELMSLNAMLPGLYYVPFYLTNIYNTDPGANSDLMKTPLVLYDDRTIAPDYTAVIYEATPSNYSVSKLLPVLTHFDFSQFYAAFQLAVAKGICYDADIWINQYEYMKLLPWKVVRVNELGGLFYLNKITNYDPYSGKPSKCQLVKFTPISYSALPASMEFAAAGESIDLVITSNVPWKLISDPAWISTDKTSGAGNDTVAVTAAANSGGPRSGTLIIRIAGKDISISLTQLFVQTFIINDDTYTFAHNVSGAGAAQVGTLTISPDALFTVSSPPAWLTVTGDQSANTVTIYPNSENTGIADRTVDITLSCVGAAGIVIHITQYFE